MKVLPFTVSDVAKSPVRDQLSPFLNISGKPALLRELIYFPGTLLGNHNPPAVFEAVRCRHFAVNVFAGFERLSGQFPLLLAANSEGNGIDVRVGQNILVIRVSLHFFRSLAPGKRALMKRLDRIAD
jgi:hypothetical protein